MTLDWALVLGFTLGLRHATDADHVVALGTLLDRAPNLARAAGIAALWGLGHTLTLCGVGLSMVLFDARLPGGFS